MAWSGPPIRGNKDKKILKRQQWNEGDKIVYIPESIWDSF